jgi:hypothetical protein
VKNDGSGISPNTFEPLSLSKAVLKAAARVSAMGLGCVKTVFLVVRQKINANRMPPAYERFAEAASAILLLRADERLRKTLEAGSR